MRPALVLADVMMPQLDGFGLLRAIRDDAGLASMPVILLSARAGEESRVEGLQAGADDYLVKPFTARELLARVEAHLKLANLRRDTSEREERLRLEAELERERLHASQERLAETSRLYRELQEREAEIRALKDQLYRENLALRDEVDRTFMFEEIVGSSEDAEDRALADRQSGSHRLHRVHLGRDRHRQGAHRPRRPQTIPEVRHVPSSV